MFVCPNAGETVRSVVKAGPVQAEVHLGAGHGCGMKLSAAPPPLPPPFSRLSGNSLLCATSSDLKHISEPLLHDGLEEWRMFVGLL